MNHLPAVAVLLIASASGPPVAAPRCPSTVQLLADVPTFSTLFGATGCVTDSAKAFLIIYGARDIEGLRTLARARTAGAQLYALCGLKHLHAEADATALRKELSASSKKTAIEFGDPEPVKMTAVSGLVVAKNGQASSDFDTTCDYLIGPGARPSRRTCSSSSARLTCR